MIHRMIISALAALALAVNVAHASTAGTMTAALAKLLERLDAISEAHDEVRDTDVREQMSAAVYHGFIVQTPAYVLPEKFGMFDSAGDVAVRAALAEFLAAARSAALRTPEERFRAFQNVTVRSKAGSSYDEYFGDSDSLEQWSAAMSRRPIPPPI
jgi:hypothetical protein